MAQPQFRLAVSAMPFGIWVSTVLVHVFVMLSYTFALAPPTLLLLCAWPEITVYPSQLMETLCVISPVAPVPKVISALLVHVDPERSHTRAFPPLLPLA